MISDYRDFTIGSMLRGTDQSPARSALLTANWRGCEGTRIRPSNRPCAIRISPVSVFPTSTFLPTLNLIEPPWYGPVCPVVWEGWRCDVSPYPDQQILSRARRDGMTASGVGDKSRSPLLVQPHPAPGTRSSADRCSSRLR